MTTLSAPAPFNPLYPSVPLTPELIEQMQQRSTLQIEKPLWEEDLESLPLELQTVLHSAISAVVQKLGPDKAQEVVKEFVWIVWKSRQANYANMMNMRMAFRESPEESVEDEQNRKTDEVVHAMHTAVKEYYDDPITPPAAATPTAQPAASGAETAF
jgi:hypothetical protein